MFKLCALLQRKPDRICLVLYFTYTTKQDNQFCDEQPLIKTNNQQSRQPTSNQDKQLIPVSKTNSHQPRQTVKQPEVETNSIQDKQPLLYDCRSGSRDKQLLQVFKTNNH